MMTTDDEAPILDLLGITLNFGGLRALDDVTFRVAAGEMIGLIGPNGAGKTTCLRVITGVHAPDHGSVRLAGRLLGKASVDARVRAGLALSNQIVRPLRALTVLDNVALAWGRRRVGGLFAGLVHSARGDARRAAAALLERVGIADLAGHRADKLPLGVFKRLEVARAMALEPRILFLDEPLAGLNHVEARRLADLIRSLNADGLTIVLVEHNLREVVRICPRLVVLESGRILADGPAGETIRNPAVIRAYIGDETAADRGDQAEASDARA
ncbi:MAG: ATP-binding cassette domain-containing protein [Burkholderiaceae bacterium]